MSVTPTDVQHVASLARLHLSAEELDRLTSELNAILAHVAELETADVEAVDSLSGVTETPAPLRDDVPGADPLAFPPADLSAHHEAGFFTVPRLAALDSEAGSG